MERLLNIRHASPQTSSAIKCLHICQLYIQLINSFNEQGIYNSDISNFFFLGYVSFFSTDIGGSNNLTLLL